MDDPVSSRSNEESQPPKKIFKSKNFKEEWYEDFPSWREWVIRVEDESKFYCKICEKTMECGKSNIIKHESRENHQKRRANLEKLMSFGISSDNSSSNLITDSPNVENLSVVQQPETIVFADSSQENSEPVSFKRKVKEAEIRITTFFLEHNLSFLIAPQLVGLFQDFDHLVLQDVKLSHTKMTSVANNVVCATETDRMINILSKQSFSVYEDETTDRTQEKWLSLMVRYIEPSNHFVRVELLQLINLDASDCSAEKIFSAFEGALCAKHIPLSNIAGMSSDNAQVMMGNKSSFKTRLQEKSPRVVVVPCVSHSTALIAKYSCAKIPVVDDLVKAIPTFLNASSKRTAIYRDTVEKLGNVFHKIPSHAETRWLVRQHCIAVIIDNWENIIRFLMVLALEKVEKASDLLKTMQKPLTLAYFFFLKYTLHMFNVYNAKFQKRESMMQELQPQSANFLYWILDRYLKKGLLKVDIFYRVIRDVDFNDPNNQLPLDEIDVGSETSKVLDQKLRDRDIGKEEVEEFRRNCLQFYATASKEIVNRLPFDNYLFSCMATFRPQIALYAAREATFSRVSHLCKVLGSFDETEISKEWQLLTELSPEIREEMLKLSFDDMWSTIGSHRADDGHKIFPNLTALLDRVRTLPHSNAEAERAFSMLTDAKTNKRNRLGTTMINSICVIRSALKARNETARTMTVTEKHFELMASQNLYKFTEPESRGSDLNLFASEDQ